METDLISLLFSQLTDNLSSFIANDISVILLAMLSLLFTVFAYFKIRDILGIGMSPEAIDARSAFHRYQDHKDSWRAPIYRAEYEEKLTAYQNAGGYKDSPLQIRKT